LVSRFRYGFAGSKFFHVRTAGMQLLVAIYGGKVGERLADLRYAAYCKSSLSHRFQAENCPQVKVLHECM